MTATGGVHGLSAAAPASTIPAPPPRWKTRVLLPVALLVIVIALVVVASAGAFLPAAPVRVVPVVMKTVEGTAGTVTVQAPGWLEPDPHPTYVAALADGVVREVLVLEGDAVAAGQVVARLVDDDARLALRRAEAEAAGRRADVDAAEAERDAAAERLEHVTEATRAARVSDARLLEAHAAVRKTAADTAVAQAKLLEMEDELRRKAPLVESEAVSAATVARLRLRVDAQRAVVDAAAAAEEVAAAARGAIEAERTAARETLELLIDERRAVALAEASVAGARAALDLAEVARDEAALLLSRMEARSPIDGVVLRRLVAPGSKLTKNGDAHSAHVLHVYDPGSLQVRVDVPLADAASIVLDQEVEVTVEVLPDRLFAGRVSRIVHEADIQKNTVEVKVAIDAPTAALKPEMLARAKFIARRPAAEGMKTGGGAATRQRIFAPQTLTQNGGALVVTGVVDGRGRVERRDVTLGSRRIDGWIEVATGLRVGDLLVADPAAVAPGDRVQIVGEANTFGETGGV